MHMHDLLPANTLLYIDDIKPRQERTKDETKKIISIGFALQPFTREMADLMGVRDRLFGRDGKPLDDVMSIALALKHVPLYTLQWRMSEDAPVGLDLADVKISPVLHVRRDKEGPVYAASFSASVLYPAADDLLTILHAYTESRYVTLEVSNAGLPLTEGETVDAEVIKPGDVLRPGVVAE